MLLYPDPREIDQPDNLTTCFSAPIDACDWEVLNAKAGDPEPLNDMRFVILGGDDIYFLRGRGQDGYKTLIVLLRDTEDADTCLESAAWIRVKFEFNGMIYICRKSTAANAWQSMTAISAAYVNEDYVAMVDIDDTE